MSTIVQINTTLNCSSTGRIAEQIAFLAEKNGYDCYIAHGGRYIRESRIESIQISSKWDNYIHAILGEFFGLHGLGSFFPTLRFIRKLEKIRPDIVHLHNVHGYYLNYKLLFQYLGKAKTPVVWTLHDCWTMTGHCTHFDKIGCDRWKTECKKCPLLKAQYKSRIFDTSSFHYRLKKHWFTYPANMTIVPVSNWLGTIVKQSFLNNAKVTVIQNGIDLAVFHPQRNELRQKLNIPSDKIILLGVASDWGPEKGLLEFEKLSKNERFQVILLGLSKKQISTLPKSIIAKERTANQQELVDYYNISTVLVNPTYNDTFPTVNIEALACGTPVVTYRTGGSPEIISPDTGYAVNRGDYDALVEAIELVIERGKAVYSEACIKRAQELYNKDDRFMDYIKLYDSLLKET